jgi:hypothetical protein
MIRGDDVIDPEHPEHRYVEGLRQAYFNCPDCGQQTRGKF